MIGAAVVYWRAVPKPGAKVWELRIGARAARSVRAVRVVGPDGRVFWESDGKRFNSLSDLAQAAASDAELEAGGGL